jgi:putative inorganic carbon (HCO3(-)) transporter
LSAPDRTSVAAVPPARLYLPATGGVAWWCLVLLVVVLCAWLTMDSLQMGCALALVVLAVGLYVRNRTAGLVAMWVLWLIVPLIRRLFFLMGPVTGPEPLALAPFLVTAAIVTFELVQVDLHPRTKRMLQFVAGGYLVGLPTGFLLAPQAATFALFAYLTAVGCFVIGYRDGQPGRTLSLPAVLMVATPLLAVYAFYQYFLPLPEWDYVWMNSVEFNSIGAPEGGRVRVWGTLNSPGTFAGILSIAVIGYVALARVRILPMVSAVAVFGALALTFVRSAWLGVVVALIAVVVVTRGAALQRVAVVGILLAAFGAATISGSTGVALTERLATFGSLGQDESGQARANAPTQVVPIALGAPLGWGIGRAGEAARLAGGGLTFRYTDNGYLSMLFQLGPVGFLLVMTGVVAGARAAFRNAWRQTKPTDVLAFGVLVFLLVTLLAGDHLFGVMGMVFWYTSGLAMRRRELYEAAA